jgi:predicted enzyme related to lactoylglutathione lyase
MLNPEGIAHVGLKAEDLIGLSDFYRHTVGLHLIEQHDGCHIFDIGAGSLLEIWAGGVASVKRKTAEQQSLRVCFKVDHLETSVQYLASKGISPLGEIGSYLSTRWVHYLDPEGNTFGLVDSRG